MIRSPPALTTGIELPQAPKEGKEQAWVGCFTHWIHPSLNNLEATASSFVRLEGELLGALQDNDEGSTEGVWAQVEEWG